MAEENAAENTAPSGGGQQKPTLFIILAIINMLVVVGVGVMVYMGKKKEEQKVTIDDVIQGEKKEEEKEAKSEEFIGKLVPMETFLFNLAQSRGRKIAKLNMEFEVSNAEVQKEISELKPKIRDMIIVILSSKTYAQISTEEGKENLRKEIRDKVNLFLTKGRIKRVYFTSFIYN
ncbi:MAG: flagellar protein FliL [Bdellovibrio sp.]|nr:MAG: flagellar protein FliL [Bdellovibrio sp.]